MIAFTGVMEVTLTSCRFLNMAVVTKGLDDDCNKAEQSYSFKELLSKKHQGISRFQIFNPIKSDKADNIKRIKSVRLYPGVVIGQEPGDNGKSEVVGGIEVVYELKSGSELTDGVKDLPCTYRDLPSKFLELKDNEYITTIYGTG